MCAVVNVMMGVMVYVGVKSEEGLYKQRREEEGGLGGVGSYQMEVWARLIILRLQCSTT